MKKNNFRVGITGGEVRITSIGKEGDYTPVRATEYSQIIETNDSVETIVVDRTNLTSVTVTDKGIEIKADKIKTG